MGGKEGLGGEAPQTLIHFFGIAPPRRISYFYPCRLLYLSLCRRHWGFSNHNLIISRPNLMKLGMEVGIRIGYCAPKPHSAWVTMTTLHA